MKKPNKLERMAYKEIKRLEAMKAIRADSIVDNGGKYASVSYNKIVGYKQPAWDYRNKCQFVTTLVRDDNGKIIANHVTRERYTTATQIAKGIK